MCKVILANLPEGVKGFTRITAEPEGDYSTIVLNARYSYEANEITFEHEEDHLNNNDFDSSDTVCEIETRRHRR